MKNKVDKENKKMTLGEKWRRWWLYRRNRALVEKLERERGETESKSTEEEKKERINWLVDFYYKKEQDRCKADKEKRRAEKEEAKTLRWKPSLQYIIFVVAFLIFFSVFFLHGLLFTIVFLKSLKKQKLSSKEREYRLLWTERSIR